MADNGIVGDRIKELRRVPVSDLVPNPKNWRIHPNAQKDAMTGLLDEIGYADALIAYEKDGELILIDGHLRAEATPDAIVPVLILDVDEDEADKILVTHDPIASMAEANQGLLERLLENVQTDNESVSKMLQHMAMGGAVGFEPVGMWEPDLNTNTPISTDAPIQSTINVRCPIYMEEEIREVIETALEDFHDVEVV